MAERVAEEMEKRKDEIEAEVLRRVEEAKSLMEQQVNRERTTRDATAKVTPLPLTERAREKVDYPLFIITEYGNK